MTTKDGLSRPVGSSDLPLSARQAIANGIFRQTLTAEQFSFYDNGLQSWFSDWFEEQCEAAATQVSALTYHDLLHVLSCLQSNSADTSRAEVANRLCTSSPTRPASGLIANDERENASLTLAARLWLSVSIDSLQHSLTPGYFVSWSDGQSLTDALGKEFSPNSQTTETVKLPKVFTAINLEKIAGIQVQWSSNLADHLVLKDDDKKIILFHQVSFLELSKNSARTLLNHDLIDETLRTLALLIPSNDSGSRKWFKRKQKSECLDSKAGSSGSLNASSRQIDKFHYWRDRLVVLKQAFDDSEPKSITSWWYDDRRKVQWYTFWVAALVLLLTILFGLIQSISGVVGAWAAVSALQESRVTKAHPGLNN